MKTFDRKFGKALFESLPSAPGVYRWFAADGALIYVGKARNLRRRLGQYRNARRRRAHRKMRAIVADAARLEFEVCASDLEAQLRETELIQRHRPRWNVAGAFSFLYPLIGVRKDLSGLQLCLVSRPEDAPDFSLHGAYRSRAMTERTFEALTELLRRVAHRLPARRIGRFGRQEGFRGLPSEWVAELERFLRGESRGAMEALVLALVDAPASARRDPRRIQEWLDSLRWFWRHEAEPLRLARERCEFAHYPVPQAERDPLFIRWRHVREEARARRRASRAAREEATHV